jgi:hypothetical protein
MAPSQPVAVEDSTQARVVLGVLALDGVLSALAGAFWLPLRVGPVPLPVSALLSGLLNVALVWAAHYWSGGGRLAALPLWAWLATVAALTLGGPGRDIVFGGPGVMGYTLVLLMILGALPAAVMLRRMR